MEKIIECVPNISEGRDLAKMECIVQPFRAKPGVKLLDYSMDKDHNRGVITVIGQPEPLRDAMIEMIGIALQTIDMTKHTGQHPRMGAVDVAPFIPLRNCTIEDADNIAKQVAEKVAQQYGLPCFLYEKSARTPLRQNLANIRQGQFEAMATKIKTPAWQPDYGPAEIHPKGGVMAIGARMPLIAYNINLNTADIEIAKTIARKIRESSGGLPKVKALGMMLKERNIAQVSMNLTDYTITPVYRVFEAVKAEAALLGVDIVGSELIGLMPLPALANCAEYYLSMENFAMDKILDTHF